MKTHCAIYGFAICVVVASVSCGESGQRTPEPGQYVIVSMVWRVDSGGNTSIGGQPAKWEKAPAGKKFLIYYAAKTGGFYQSKDFVFKMVLAGGKEIEPSGTRLERFFSPLDTVISVFGPEGNAFTLLPLVTGYASGPDSECLSLLFVLSPDETVGARILRKKGQEWHEVSTLSGKNLWAGPPRKK